MTNQKTHKKTVAIILLILIGLITLIAYFEVIKPQQKANKLHKVQIDGVFLPDSKAINDFKLIDHRGNAFTKNNLIGHWTMMFFGFTNCASVCPVTLSELNKMYKVLQNELPASQLPQIVLVSVDPERDTTTRMKEYVSSFNPDFIGVSGSLKETHALEKQLHIVAIKMPAKGKDKNHYGVDHSAEILLFNPEAKLQAYLSFPHKSDQMVKDYKLIVKSA